MKSFGLWYLKSDNQTGIDTQGEKDDKVNTGVKSSLEEKSNKKLSFSFHVNFWSLEDCEYVKNGQVPYLDIGIMVDNYEEIKEMTFYCPFEVEDNNIIDLAEKMEAKNNANIIFNEDCEIHTTGNYTVVEKNKEKLLIFPLQQVIKNVYFSEINENGTYLKFNFENFLEYVNSNDTLKEISRVYIRFRITGNALKKNIYFDSEPLNKSFESAFSGTRMIDFKINEKRNIDEKIRAEIIVNHEKFANLKRVHFLVMEPSAYDVKAFDNQQMSCRELEEKIWDDYLDEKLDFTKGHILAYHWKQKDIESGYSCLVKVNYSKARPMTIISYALIVIALGIISSAIVSAIGVKLGNDFQTMIYCILGGIILLVCAIVMGNKSK